MDFHWIAHYDDGSTFSQLRPDGTRNRYPDIDRDRIHFFDLWAGDRLLVRLDLRDDGLGRKRLVWRMRNQIRGGQQQRVHLAGYLRANDGPHVMCYVFEDGAVLVSGAWAEEPFMAPVRLQEAER